MERRNRWTESGGDASRTLHTNHFSLKTSDRAASPPTDLLKLGYVLHKVCDVWLTLYCWRLFTLCNICACVDFEWEFLLCTCSSSDIQKVLQLHLIVSLQFAFVTWKGSYLNLNLLNRVQRHLKFVIVPVLTQNKDFSTTNTFLEMHGYLLRIY